MYSNRTVTIIINIAHEIQIKHLDGKVHSHGSGLNMSGIKIMLE